jgi:hypothetical protein
MVIFVSEIWKDEFFTIGNAEKAVIKINCLMQLISGKVGI